MVSRATSAPLRDEVEPSPRPRRRGTAGLERQLVLGEMVDPWAILSLARRQRPCLAWSDPRSGTSFVGWGAADTFVPQPGPAPPLLQVSSWAHELGESYEQVAPDLPLVLFGGAFAPGSRSGPWHHWPRAYAFVPRLLAFVHADGRSGLLRHGLGADAELAVRTSGGQGAASTPGRGPAAEAWLPEPSPADYRAAVSRLLAAIGRGGLNKVVLARSACLHARAGERFCPLQTALALRAQQGAAISFMVEIGDDSFVGATPEILASVSGGVLRSQAVAGTSEVANDPGGRDLVASDKDRREHGWVVDGIRQALAPWGTAAVTPAEVARAGEVQHLVSDLTLPLPGGVSVIDAAARLHPTPALCGEPRPAAERWIDELEHFDRGWYAGPLGWCSPSGDGVVAVAIRSLLMTEDRATAFAGAGIVSGSRPQLEWLETEHKLRSVQGALRVTRTSRRSTGGGLS